MSFQKAVEQRKKRIDRLKQLIEENPDKPLDQILAMFAVETGVSEPTARRYYRLLVKAGVVEDRAQQH